MVEMGNFLKLINLLILYLYLPFLETSDEFFHLQKFSLLRCFLDQRKWSLKRSDGKISFGFSSI